MSGRLLFCLRLVTAAAVLLSGPRVDSRDSAHLVRARARAALRARTRARTRARARVRARARATVQPAPLRPERGGLGLGLGPQFSQHPSGRSVEG